MMEPQTSLTQWASAGVAILPAEHTAIVSHEITVRIADLPQPLLADVSPGGLKTRPELTIPIRPGAEFSDTVLYEDAATPERKFYLPRYRLAEETVSGRSQYRIALKTQGQKWAFSVVLEKFPAPEIQLAARDASELPHDPHVILTHRLFMNGVPTGLRERQLSVVEPLATGVQATVVLDTLEERDEVYRALTEVAYGSNLEVRRRVRAAVLVPPSEAGAYIVSTGNIQLNPGDGFDVIAGAVAADHAHLRWTSDQRIAPQSGVQVAKLGVADLAGISVEQLRAAGYSNEPLQCDPVPGPDALVLTTPHWNPPGGGGGVYLTHPQGIWYAGTQWSIFNQNMQAMPANAAFVVVPFGPGRDALLHRAELPRQDWGGWIALATPPGGFQHSPAAISRAPQVSNVYVRGADNALWQLAWYSGQWHGWARHSDGGTLMGEPAAGSMGSDHEHVFVQGLDGRLYQKWWTSGQGWTNWVPLGAPPVGFVGRPAVVSRNPQVCNVYVRGGDNALWQLAWYEGQWHPWGRHADGVLTSSPGVASMGPDHEHVFVRGTDGQVFQKWWTASGGWSAYVPLGAPPGGVMGSPAVACRDSRLTSLYVQGKDQTLWQRLWTGDGWLQWTRDESAPRLGNDPSAEAIRGVHERIVIRGADGQVWHKEWPGVQTAGNIISNWTRIDDPALNGNPNALCQVTQNWNPMGSAGTYNAHHIGVFFASPNWAIFNQDRAPMPPGASFNVRRTPPDKGFVHRADASNIQGHVTIIRHALLDGRPDKKLLATPNWNPGGVGGVYDDHPIGVYYTGANWAIYNQDRAAMPVGAAFNVEIVDRPDAFFHVAAPQTNRGNYTLLTIQPREGAVSNNHVVSVRTGEQHLAKMQVLDCRRVLQLRWVTFSEADRYREETANLDLTHLRDSWVFPPNLYGYIYSGITDVGGSHGLVRHSVEWQGTQYPYYQDGTTRRTFYYLPDVFKIARKNAERKTPDMSMRIGSPDGSVERASAAIGYVAAAVTDGRRLNAAKERLRSIVPQEVGDLAFEPLRPTRLTFKLGLPRPGSTAISFIEQTDALVTIDTVRHSLELPIEAFRAVFEALFTESSLIFQGQVEVTLGDETVPPIPFQGRFSDLAGDPVVCVVSRQADHLTVTLRNVIESAIRIHELTATVVDANGNLAAATIEGLTLPADVAAGQQISFRLRTASPLSSSSAGEARFDLRRVEVMTDRNALCDAIIDTSAAPEYVRRIRVRTVREIFQGSEPKLTLIRVNLKREEGAIASVDLSEDHLEDVAQLHAPFRDYILGRVDRGEFQYQVVAVRGAMRTTSAYKAATSDLLITSEDLA